LSSNDLSKHIIDDNGYLRIKACIFKEGVYNVGLELENEKGEVIGELCENMFYPLSEFASSTRLTQLQSVPVIIGHREINVENASQYKIGHVVGDPILENGSIFFDLIIDNEEAKSQILKKELHDISLAYRFFLDKRDGILNNVPYKYTQTDIFFNHIGLLPYGEGRMGTSVKIFNKGKDEKMGKETKENYDDKDGKNTNDDVALKLLNELKELRIQNSELTEKLKEVPPSEDLIEEKIKESVEENKLAETIDNAIGSKIANSGLRGEKLYEKCLNSCGIESTQVSSKKEAFHVLVAGIRNVIKNDNKNDRIKTFDSIDKPETTNFGSLKFQTYDDQVEYICKREINNEKGKSNGNV
jgi:hypothetical protein